MTVNGGPHLERCILVTGGAGYIGTHTSLQLLLDGYKVVILDNLANSSEEGLRRVVDLAGKQGEKLVFYKADLCDKDAIEAVFDKHRFDAVIHFAGLKAVGESCAKPLPYYINNILGTLNLLDVMNVYNCKKLVFSSSATVYGQPESVPVTEESRLFVLNPYGRTKLQVEEMMRDITAADPDWRCIVLRYFNPVGAHPSGRLGEDPQGFPNNLMPFVQQVAVGRRKELTVFGTDYNTKDGTGVRDYIHVQDLATGHSAALHKLFTTPDIGCTAYNLGTGKGTSVLEIVAAFEKAAGLKIPLRIAGRRPGDCSVVYTATEKARKELGWKAQNGIDEMCRDQWKWASNNPDGYRSSQEKSPANDSKPLANGNHEAVLNTDTAT
ncbi:UDP-glucose 4-epimerase 5 [Physcomitrium patens]|uniref:UDP-glucose 4-epimerase n=1 Tax=Physcomitrium patens TaxID=3218 RepID=A9RBB7_PHYPA|nr:UDP-glucose 4-epimerase 5-like [Physcomitrium patens]PNR56881.1 hypothetical protein PHYPA_003873 [Physcomitrium patens]|eukprot:XP_024371982.1 UDP-glucose 4-epimerase 5-like [Physcomitrella patens]